MAPRIPRDCPFVTCLISPPIEIEKAAPISGRKAQLESKTVWPTLDEALVHPAFWAAAITPW